MPELLVGLLLTVALSWLGAQWLDLPPPYVALATTGYVVMSALVVYGWMLNPESSQSLRGFGWANRITLLRALPVLAISALIPFPETVAENGWMLAWLSLGALILDGVDGKVARMTASQSAFGARFDMELDAFFILALTLVITSMGKAGAWIIALGLIRYGFVVAAYVWPWLERSLPDSFRRKTVCVWQVVSLLVCLLPPITDDLAPAILALALGLLVYSFAVDLRWLLRCHHRLDINREVNDP